MKEELNKKEITDTSKDSKQKVVVFGIVFIFVILFIIIIALTLFKGNDREKQKPSNTNNNVENYYNYDYKYVLQTTFGADYFIYLLNDNSVKVVGKIPVAETCEGMDCIELTGEYNYEETTIEFSDKSMDKVRNFISSLFDKKLTNYLNLENLELTKEQERIELALLLNLEDLITFEDDLIFETKTKELKNSVGKVIFEMSKTTIAPSNNEAVSKIGSYLNAIVENEWNLLDEECKEVIAEGFGFSGSDIIEFSLNLEEINAYNVSFTYTMSGTFEETVRHDIKGFVFNTASGEIKEYPTGWRNPEKVLEEFKKSEEYKSIQENLKLDWENILIENMYKPGYWHLKEDKIIFLIPETLISESPTRGHIIELSIDNTHGNF